MKEEEEDLVLNMKNLILNNGSVDKLINEQSFQGDASTFANSTLVQPRVREARVKGEKLMLLNPQMESFLSFGEEKLSKTRARFDQTAMEAPAFDTSRFFECQADDLQLSAFQSPDPSKSKFAELPQVFQQSELKQDLAAFEAQVQSRSEETLAKLRKSFDKGQVRFEEVAAMLSCEAAD